MTHVHKFPCLLFLALTLSACDQNTYLEGTSWEKSHPGVVPACHSHGLVAAYDFQANKGLCLLPIDKIDDFRSGLMDHKCWVYATTSTMKETPCTPK